MKCIDQNRDVIKAIAGLNISATAKLVGQVMLLAGAANAADVMELTGLTKSTAYRCMHEFMNAGGLDLAPVPKLPTCPIVPTGGNPTLPKVPTDGNYDQDLAVAHADADIASHATKELPTEVLISKKDITPFSPQTNEKVEKENSRNAWSKLTKQSSEGPEFAEFIDGRIVLSQPLADFWLPKFDGDAERLDLALIQAVPYVQENSSRSVTAQVNCQLAQNASRKRDGDKRFKANGKPASADHAKRPPWVEEKIKRQRDTMKMAKEMGLI